MGASGQKIGEEVERCRWAWENVQKIVDLGIRQARQVGQCPFCGRFFERSEGFPRIDKKEGGRRFGTRACWKAWEMDQKMAVE